MESRKEFKRDIGARMIARGYDKYEITDTTVAPRPYDGLLAERFMHTLAFQTEKIFDAVIRPYDTYVALFQKVESDTTWCYRIRFSYKHPEQVEDLEGLIKKYEINEEFEKNYQQ